MDSDAFIGTVPHRDRWAITDVMPQLICIVDEDGRVMRVDRTVERWRAGTTAKSVMGLSLHDALHGNACYADCYLRQFTRRLPLAFSRRRRIKCGGWDGILKRYVSIRTTVPDAFAGQQGPTQPFGIVTATDVSRLRELEALGQGSARRVQPVASMQLSPQHWKLQESERRRIACDLHDGLGQMLTMLKIAVKDTARLLGSGVEGARGGGECVGRLASLVEEAIDEVRRISLHLRPSTLDDLGLLATLSWLTRQVEESPLRLRVEKNIAVCENDVPEALKTTIFRIVQEAVNNSVKHSAADTLRISLSNGADLLRFCVEDNGIGFDPMQAAPKAGAHLGLQSMRERAELSGGRYALHSAPGRGTRISICWRLKPLAPADSVSSASGKRLGGAGQALASVLALVVALDLCG